VAGGCAAAALPLTDSIAGVVRRAQVVAISVVSEWDRYPFSSRWRVGRTGSTAEPHSLRQLHLTLTGGVAERTKAMVLEFDLSDYWTLLCPWHLWHQPFMGEAFGPD